MRVIHKFGPFNPGQEFVIENMYRVVLFAEQAGELFVWVEKNLDVGIKRDRNFVIVGTGRDYEVCFEHKQSLVDSNFFVWHLLEERGPLENFAERIF